jgi:hypothetical protein
MHRIGKWRSNPQREEMLRLKPDVNATGLVLEVRGPCRSMRAIVLPCGLSLSYVCNVPSPLCLQLYAQGMITDELLGACELDFSDYANLDGTHISTLLYYSQ